MNWLERMKVAVFILMLVVILLWLFNVGGMKERGLKEIVEPIWFGNQYGQDGY